MGAKKGKGLNLEVSGFRHFATTPVSTGRAVSALKPIRDSGVQVCAHAC